MKLTSMESTRSRSRRWRRLGRWSLLAIAAFTTPTPFGPSLPALAAHPVQAPTVYHVRPGATVLACGGFDGHCEVRLLSGALETFFGYAGHPPDDSSPPAIVSSELELVTSSGHASPFPGPSDLALTALEGSTDGLRLRFESPASSAQTAELVLTPFRDGSGASGGFVLTGFYDEGCCDRYRLDLGNVVLRPEGGPGALQLQGGRFRATVTWRSASGRQGTGKPVALDDASGYFWFFQPENPEVLLKVLDACAVNGHYWIFAAGLTNLGVEITLFDQRSDVAFPILNPVGRTFATFIDTTTLRCGE